ncbi:histidine kinase dimerization/phospho-acceptor domain-containing protein [Novosphingobium sediminicola]|uniref:histidine kinase n=1 Tax=Novosphingobium sediminicola TaxID=563162 RepID=A0A7W6G5S6_9SPHN|nr:histidine kinase dimerization/phospho-acceptor domain-containing protein [Novosphingobium sediminicola]MBB3954553.1 signal transduction histidine kinase [Novosphingobium sediminicola]
MRYDDRLATALRLTPVGQGVARIQFRQLLDLLGTLPVDEQGEMVDLAYLRLGELGGRIPAADRAAILRQPGLRLRAPRLVAALAGAEPVVSLSALHSAQLSDEQWIDLIPALPLASRGALGMRRDLGPGARALLARLGIGDPALPATSAPKEPAPVEEAPAPVQTEIPSKPARASAYQASPPLAEDTIGALVRRIEAFRQARENNIAAEAARPAQSKKAKPGQPIRSFDFASDGEGRIVWAEARVAPMVVGYGLGGNGPGANAVRLHQPFRAVMVTLAGAPAIAGEWQVDAVPRFDPLGGRYIGHLGRFRRPAAVAAAPVPAAPAQDSETDRLRQLLHELRTPVNAIQGFAEVIQQQLFGPTPHEYRALAAVVAADSALMLAGFEELDRYARLESGSLALAGGECDLAAALDALVSRLAGDERGPALRLEGHERPCPIALDGTEAERLCWRLLATLAGNGGAGEALPIRLSHRGGAVLAMFTLPQTLAALSDEALFHGAAPATHQPGAGMFGTGFALRLAAAEARAAGGGLIREGQQLLLTLPGLTLPMVNLSQVPENRPEACKTPVA